jgi:hypothetical protein
LSFFIRKTNMNRLLAVLTAGAMTFGVSAFAQEATSPVLSGEVELKFSENAATDKWGGAMGLDLDIAAGDLATVDLDFGATDGNAVTLDSWEVGTSAGGIGLSFGDDMSVMPDAEGNHTLTKPAMAEALGVEVGNAKVAIGLTDWTADVMDVSNIQGAYTLNPGAIDLTLGGDLNLDSDNIVLGAGVDGLSLGDVGVGGAMSYDMDAEKFAFEGTTTVAGITAYANGDQDDALQNVGGEYVYGIGGAELTAGTNYNLDTEVWTPSVTVGFSF